MGNQIHLSKDELMDYLTEIDKAEHFKGWLLNKRQAAQTLDSLLTAPTNGKPAKAGRTTTGDVRNALDYVAVILPVMKAAGTKGVTIEEICKEASLSYDEDYGRVNTWLRNKVNAKKYGISAVEGKFSCKADEVEKQTAELVTATGKGKKGNK